MPVQTPRKRTPSNEKEPRMLQATVPILPHNPLARARVRRRKRPTVHARAARRRTSLATTVSTSSFVLCCLYARALSPTSIVAPATYIPALRRWPRLREYATRFRAAFRVCGFDSLCFPQHTAHPLFILARVLAYGNLARVGYPKPHPAFGAAPFRINRAFNCPSTRHGSNPPNQTMFFGFWTLTALLVNPSASPLARTISPFIFIQLLCSSPAMSALCEAWNGG